MEYKINLMELSIEQITKKIKAFKGDTNLTGLTLYVKRKQSAKSHKNIKLRQCQPNNVDTLLQKRKMNKQRVVEEINQNLYNKQNILHIESLKDQQDVRKQQDNSSEEDNSYQFIGDNRMNKARKNYAHGNYEAAIALLITMLEEAKTEKKGENQFEGDKQRKIANLTFQLGNCYYRKKNYDKAIQYYSLQIPEQNYKYKAMRKSNLGAIYLNLKKNQQSLRHYTQALKIYSQNGQDNIDLSNIYYNVGNIYLRQKMYQIAQKYFHMSIQERKSKSADCQLPMFYSAFKLGLCQKLQQKYQQSIKSLFYAFSFAQRGVGDPIQVEKQIASVYELIGKNNEALNYYQKICDNPKSTEEDKGYAYEKAAMIYIKQQQQAQGQRIMKIAYQCYERAGNQRKVSFIRQNFKINSVLM